MSASVVCNAGQPVASSLNRQQTRNQNVTSCSQEERVSLIHENYYNFSLKITSRYGMGQNSKMFGLFQLNPTLLSMLQVTLYTATNF